MILTETKIQTKAYNHNQLGYNVTCLVARISSAGGAQGSVGLVTREQPDEWGIESTRFHGLNVVSCNIVTRHTRTLLISAYLPPSTLENLLDFMEALQRFKSL